MTTKKVKKKPGRKPKKKLYFGEEVQDAIIEYNDSDNYGFRNKIYQNEIHPAFDKLAENIINTFKFSYFDYPFKDVKNEVVAFLVMNMHKYDHTKGAKAFSYFSVVAKNYLILNNNNNYKKLKSHDNIDVMKSMSAPSEHDSELAIDLTKDVIEYFDENILKIFNKKRDIQVAYAIVELFKKRQEIENFNKKALYILIREMTDVNTIHITSVVNVFKKHYKKIIENHYSNGFNKNTSTLSKFF
tara:strand:- start:2186 stop:2914 length:729 start_codon:yes stop_codon:yes gene_type:complete